jgi:hypothetical protein
MALEVLSAVLAVANYTNKVVNADIRLPESSTEILRHELLFAFSR